ncbi:MAG: hypothetical protein K1X67_21600 [Fimbriimonadaceae bacterium]|nr:hypothetical protein [Fimbriimonadaceae bacterium]
MAGPRRAKRIQVLPGPKHLRHVLAEFAKQPGVVTCLTDDALPVLRDLLPEGSQVEVKSLGELVGNVLVGFGEPSLPVISKGQLRALISLACSELPPSSPLAASARFAGTHESLQKTLSELSHWGFDVEALDQLGESNDLCRDFAWLGRQIDIGLDRLHRGTATSRINRCFELGTVTASHVKRVLAIVGDVQHPLAEKWFDWLASNGSRVTLVVESEERSHDSWASLLFGPEVEKMPFDVPLVEISSAADILAEAEWALRGCLRALKDGVLHHRIAIVARDRESYAPMLIASARRLGVTLSIPFQFPLMTNGFASFVAETLEAISAKDVRRLSSVVSRSYAGSSEVLKQHAIDAIRQVATLEDPWAELTEWASERQAEQSWLAHLTAWRQSVARESFTLAGWLDAFKKLLEGGGLPERVMSDHAATRERDQRANTALQRAIADTASIFGADENKAMSLGAFVALARRLWEPESTVLPPSPNGVRVVASGEQVGEVDVLFVLGMLEGVLPRRRTEDPILSDEIRAWISAQRPDLPPLQDSNAIGPRERREFVRLCAAPSKRLVLSYPQTGENRDNIPAFFLTEIGRQLKDRVRAVDHRRVELTPTPDDCLAPADSSLAAALAGPRVLPESPTLATLLGRLAIRPEFEHEGIDPREIAASTECPFKAAARFRLGLFPNARRDPWGRLMRLPIRASLPSQPDPASAEATLRLALRGELDRLLGQLEFWEIGLLEAGAQRFIRGWVEREFASRAQWKQEESELRTNVDLDDPALENLLPGPDKVPVRLIGQVAGLSRIGPYSKIQSYVRRAPKDLRLGENPEITADQLLFGLYIVTEARRSQALALEVDSADDQRILYLLPRVSDVAFLTSGNLRVLPLGESRRAYLEPIMVRFREAIQELDRAKMEARPGNVCRLCDYGELCRVSSRFGEVIDDPFT